MKTPERIKKGLECCVAKPKGLTVKDCDIECPYFHEGVFCKNALHGDTKQIIQQLESRLAQVERERDAAVVDLTGSAPCFACDYFIRNKGTCKGGKRCFDEQFKAEIGHSEYDGPEWKWRGVCPENSKEE